MGELGRLAESAGAKVLTSVVQERAAPTPSLHFGRGKVDEVRELASDLGATLLISDDPLTPIQKRNLARALKIRVIDRTALILDISSQPARASEGKRQVERPHLPCLLP